MSIKLTAVLNNEALYKLKDQWLGTEAFVELTSNGGLVLQMTNIKGEPRRILTITPAGCLRKHGGIEDVAGLQTGEDGTISESAALGAGGTDILEEQGQKVRNCLKKMAKEFLAASQQLQR